jgi:SEC-C motif
MESDHPESEPTPAAETNEPTPEEGASALPDPATLVDRLIEAGEWPDPALVGQIIAAGEAAVGPLLDYMRTYPSPEEYGREIVLYHGMGILGMIHSRAAIPVLVEIIKRYPEESGEEAARVLGEFEALAFEPALELVRDPEIKGYPRRHAIEAARRAAGSDPTMRARLAERLRPMLADALDRTREADRQNAMEPDDEDEGESEGWVLEDIDEEEVLGDEDSLDEDDLEDASDEESTIASRDVAAPELEPYEEVMFLVGDLASLADPEAREMIKTAFAEDLVDTFWIDEKFIEDQYREGGEAPGPTVDWLEDYRERYQRHLDALNRPPAPLRPLYQPSRRATYAEAPDESAPLPPQETIRNTGPKLGRNDPCWCGSGKKYKKCHWGKPGP